MRASGSIRNRSGWMERGDRDEYARSEKNDNAVSVERRRLE
jgi:hypothetical protein